MPVNPNEPLLNPEPLPVQSGHVALVQIGKLHQLLHFTPETLH